MIVGLDFDETYTRDPETWDKVIAVLRAARHTVYCVTMRYPGLEESLEVSSQLNGKVDACFFTGRKGKRDFMYAQGINVHVWIDDMPDAIIMDFHPHKVSESEGQGLWVPGSSAT
ncbi:hypothetical protein [Achromobacter phage Motura]|uniref:Uncharacterized protein n=1 Tax=Achromobacter phage Motura TaxID=2591403 RepID=A0A514CSI3_9CAUD|nr:hypothetical protein H1O15_gp022 [Achromobacter phage Motura]QDH83430.1 hypothetical protein [Achromobacter phage Motura]